MKFLALYMVQKNLHKGRAGKRSLFGTDTLTNEELSEMKVQIESEINDTNAGLGETASVMQVTKQKLLLEQALKDVNDALA